MAALRTFLRYPNTIYDCCEVIYLILFSLGCSGFMKHRDRFNYSRRTLCFTCLAVCWYVGSLVACVYVKLEDAQVKNLDILIKSIIYLEMGMSTFTYLTTACCMLSNMEKNLRLYARIQDLDEILFKEFNCKLNYEKLMLKHIIIFSFVTVTYMSLILAAVSQASNGRDYLVYLLGGLTYTAVTGSPHLNCYAQINMAELLTIRFQLLQKLLTKYVTSSSKLNTLQKINYLRRLVYLVQEYHNCIKEINQVYALCLASTLLHDFTLTTSELYLNLGSKNMFRESSLIWYVSVCMILALCKMTLAPVYCDRSTRELYSQMFKYLLILIQFRMTQEIWDQIKKQKNTILEWIRMDNI